MKQKEKNSTKGSQDQIKENETSNDGSKEDSKNIEHEENSQNHVLAASPRQGAMTLSPEVVKPKTTKSTKKKTFQAVTPNVTRALQSRGKFPK